MNSLIKNTPRESLIKRSIPPLYKDLRIWTNRVYDPTTHQIKSRISPQYNITLKQGLTAYAPINANLQFVADIVIDESASDYTCVFTPVGNDELSVSVAGVINKLATVAGAVYVPTPSGFKNIGAAMAMQASNDIDFNYRSDDALFYCDEHPFAVKSGEIFPMKLDGTGYAGLVGEPDATYQGLIALQGGIEVAGQNYLKTLFDFEQTVNTVIEDAGLILDDYTALDCNDDLIYTADPYLSPLAYPNAFTAMTLANVSQQRYSDLADNNASRRIFIKYRRGTDVTDDGSRALVTAGTIAEILVYKRDLSVAEAIRVLKYCADMPMDNQVMSGDQPTLDGDNNFVYTCAGHIEPEIEIEEP